MDNTNNRDSSRTTAFSIVSISCAAYSGLFAMPLWLGSFTDTLQVNPSLPGYMGSVQLLLAMAAALYASSKINQLKLHKVALFGALCILLASTLSSFIRDITLLFVCRGLSGIGEGLLLAMLNASISKTDNPDKYFALSQTTVAFFGIILFATAPTAMVAYGAIGVFAIVVLFSVIALPAALLLPGFTAQEAPGNGSLNTGSSSLYLLALISLAIVFIGCQGSWAYMERMGIAKNFSLQTIGGFFIIGQLVSLLGPITANYVTRAFNRKFAITSGSIVSGVATLMASQTISDSSFIAAAVLFQFGTLFMVTSFYGYLAALDTSGRAVSAAPGFLNFGSALGPAVMAGAISFGGYPLLGLAVTGTYTLALVLLFIQR